MTDAMDQGTIFIRSKPVSVYQHCLQGHQAEFTPLHAKSQALVSAKIVKALAEQDLADFLVAFGPSQKSSFQRGDSWLLGFH